jgi:hypothetical protein
MSTLELLTSRSLSASRTPPPSIHRDDRRAAPKTDVGTDVAKQRAWLAQIDAEVFYANVPCTD